MTDSLDSYHKADLRQADPSCSKNERSELLALIDRLIQDLIPLVHLALAAELDRPDWMIHISNADRDRSFPP